MIPHRLEESREDGLAVCLTCGGAEASLPTDCPGRKMTGEEQDEVQAGAFDYRGSGWTTIVQYLGEKDSISPTVGWDGPGWYWWGSEVCRGPYPSRAAAWESYDQRAAGANK